MYFCLESMVIWKLPCNGLLGQLRKHWLEWRRIPSLLPSPSWEHETELNPWLKAILGLGAVPPPYWVHSSTCQAHWDPLPIQTKPTLAPQSETIVTWVLLHPR